MEPFSATDDLPDDEELDYTLFSFDRLQPGLAFELSDSLDSDSVSPATSSKNPPIQQARTRRLRENLVPATACNKVLSVLAYMDSLGLDLALFLDLLSWGDQSCTENMKINYERTALMVSKELPLILKRWYRPPRSPGSTAARAAGASGILECFAFDCVAEVVGDELEGVTDVMRCSADELSSENISSFQLDDLLLKLSSPGLGGTPKLWSLLQQLTVVKQPTRAIKHSAKSVDLVVLSVICQIEKARSHHNSRFAKFVTAFLRSQGTPAKSIDLLRTFGLTMSYQWSNRSLVQISANEMAQVRSMVKTHPFVITYDNVNIPFHVFTQRLDNQSHFDSGTASTIFFQPNAPIEPPLDNHSLQESRACGSMTPLTASMIYKLSQTAAPIQFERDVYRVLRFLLDSADFDLASYEYRDHPLFTPPPSVTQLPLGAAYATRQFMLGTEHIEEASYDGNDQVIQAIMHQLGLDSEEEMKKTGLERVLICIGDQLTAERLRGLYKFRAQDRNSYDRLDWTIVIFGWFHLQMAFANSLHKQYLGTTAGRGLMHAFTLLERKGLHTVQTRGPFHQHLHDAIICVAEAHFRACWKALGDVNSLTDLQSKNPSELQTIATDIVQHLASSTSIEDIDMLPDDDQDQELRNSVLWNRDVLRYLDLDEAIRGGDVGVMEQTLPYLAFRFAGGGNFKYTIEILELLQGLHHDWPPEISDFIRRKAWLVNMTGHPQVFLPLDKRQEYNIKAIKVTNKVQGPNASWDLLKSRSPAIPMLHAIHKHMEKQIPSLQRGKSHTNPTKEKDIQRLEESYQSSKVHSKHKGRKMRHTSDIIVDIVSQGANKLFIGKVMGRWWEQRDIMRARTESW